MLRRGLILFGMLGLSACQFDPAVSPNLVIECSTDSDCPAGLNMKCSPLKHHCFVPGGDQLAPVLHGELSKARARPGEPVTLTVTSTKELRGRALIDIHSTTETVRTEPDDAGVVTFTGRAGEPDGLITFFGSAEDLAGNEVNGVRLAELSLDATPPVLVSAELSTQRLAPGALFVLVATFDEELRDPVQLEVTTSGGVAALAAPVSQSGRLATFNVQVRPNASSGPIALRLLGAVDLVGNDAGPLGLSGPEVDADPPLLTTFDVLPGARFSAQPGFNLLSVVTGASGATRVEVCLETRCTDVQPMMGMASFTVELSDGEGERRVTARAFDDVGNEARLSRLVTFDFSPPQFLNRALTYAAGPGCTLSTLSAFGDHSILQVSFTVNEPLGAAPTVNGPAQFATPQGSGLGWLSSSVGPPLSTGDAGVSASLSDVVGNSATLSVGTAVIDQTPPMGLPPGKAATFVYRRLPFGSLQNGGTVEFTVEAADGTFAPSTKLTIRSEDGGVTLAELPVTPTGGVASVRLSSNDAPLLTYQQLDEACNASLPAAVPTVEWVVSLVGRDPTNMGSVRNPHRFVDVFAAGLRSRSGEFREHGADVALPNDSLDASVSGPPVRWMTVVSDAGTTNFAGSCAVEDPRTGLINLFMGPSLAEMSRYVRRPNGLWLIDELPVGNVPTSTSRCAFDEKRQGFLSFCPSNACEWDGIRWANTTAMRTAIGSAFAPTSRGLFEMNSATSALSLWDESWSSVSDGGVVSDAGLGFDRSLTWSHAHGGLVRLSTDNTPPQMWLFSSGAWTQLSPAAIPNPNANGFLVSNPVTGALLYAAAPSSVLTTAGWVAAGTSPLSARNIVALGDGGFLTASATLTVTTTDLAQWTTQPPVVDRLGFRDAGVDGGALDVFTGHLMGGNTLVWAAEPPDAGESTWVFNGLEWTTTYTQPAGMRAAAGTVGNNNLGVLLGQNVRVFGQPTWFAPLKNAGSSSYLVEDSAGAATLGQSIITFGGRQAGYPQGETHQWNVSTTSYSVTRLAPALSPIRRSGPAMASFPTRGRVVLFGGHLSGFVSGAFNDTWEFDGTTWTQVMTAHTPPARGFASLIWDPIRRHVVLHGGIALPQTLLSDTWVYDGVDWYDITPLVGTPRSPGKAVWDPQSNSILLHTNTGVSYLESQPVTVGQRLMPDVSTLRMPAQATGLELRVTTQSAASSGRARCQLWNGQRWDVRDCAATQTGADVTSFLDAGLQLMPMLDNPDGGWPMPVITPVTLSTDFIEATVRYSLP